MALLVPQTRGNGALDLFNNQQARFFNRMLLVELGAHRPVSQHANMSREKWATTHSWSQEAMRTPTPDGRHSRARSRPLSRAQARDQWMAVPRGTPDAPSPIGAAFPQMPSRGEAATSRGGAVTRYGQEDGQRPGTADSHRQVIERREKYQRPAAYAGSLKERIEKARKEEKMEQEKLVQELNSSSRFSAARISMQKNIGATQLYAPDATLLRTSTMQGSGRQTLPSSGWMV
jgi:hypothetical protein